MIYFLIICSAIFFPITCGVMASKKNRNIPLWVLLGATGGIIAYLVLALMPYQCPYCKSDYYKNSDGLRCGSCGEPDKLINDDLTKYEDLKKTFIEKGWKIKADGVKIKLTQSSGAKLSFVGVKSLEEYAARNYFG